MSDATPAAVNVLGEPLQPCCTANNAGFFRDGLCRTDSQDLGRHVICAIVTDEFLDFSASRGNDLKTPIPMFDFPGLNAGDRWCLCATRWREAMRAGCAPRVDLAATEETALAVVTLSDLQAHAAEH
ncbi:MAG: DUF2237 domain-containing protein [Pseudomonadota bacterium]